MSSTSFYPIIEEHEEYYKFLEAIRRTGVVNMREAYKFLMECFKMTEEDSRKILYAWMYHYDKLSDLYNWN
jgi:hypothetical protein